jgi:protein-S-isoprenylcysteine O-methyltransferase Ste14
MKTRIPPPMYALFAAWLMWWIDRRVPIARPLEVPWNHTGWVLIAIGIGLDGFCALSFAKAATTINPMRVSNASQLVIGGPYRWSRNPMYLGLVITLLGWGILLGSVGPFAIIPIFGWILAHFQIAPEEAALEAKFGDSYRRYRRQVNRWIGVP